MHKIFIICDLHRGSYKVIAELYQHILQSCSEKCFIISTPKDSVERKVFSSKIPLGSLCIHITLGDSFIPIPGSYNIAQPWHEWSKYPPHWIGLLNQFDEIWSPTNHLSELLQNSALKSAIYKLPPTLVPEEIPQKIDWKKHSPTRFYFVGEPHFRKGHHLLMQGFIKAFPKVGESQLTIKTNPSCEWESPREDIILIKEFWSREQLLAEYSNHDCFVSASLAEGLGLPIAEAIKAKLPICTNYWGGHKDLVKNGAFIEIVHEEVIQPFTSNPKFYAEDQKCAYSSPENIKNALLEFINLNSDQKEVMVNEAYSYLDLDYGKTACIERIKARLGDIEKSERFQVIT